MPKQIFFDGARMKSINPWDVDDPRGWTVLGNGTATGELWQRVPWFYRGMKDRANNVSSMPWGIYAGEDEVSNSANWRDAKPAMLDFITNPRRLFSQIEQSLVIAGKAYLALECNKSGYVKGMKYLNPSTIEEVYDKATGEITGYLRKINGKQIPCTPANMPPENGKVQILAIYDPDYTAEIGPGCASDGLAAMTAAGVLLSYDEFTRSYFDRGAIKASIMTIESGTPQEQERLQAWWTDVVSGVRNAFTGLVFRGKVNSPVVIGDGLEAISNGADTLATQRRQDISTALGIPESRLWSSAANYATRKEDEAAYYRGTIIPECGLIREALNEQLFTKEHKLDGWHIEFQPETLDVFQEDETSRAGALGQLTTAGIPLVTAMEILGYDLTDEQWEAIREKDEPEPEEVPAIVQPEAVVIPEIEPVEEVEDETAPMMSDADRIASTRAMLKNWERKCKHVHKMTGSADVEWVTDLLPASQVEDIKQSLQACETAAQIKGVFAGVIVPEVVQAEAVVKADPLSDELKRATDVLEQLLRAEPPTTQAVKAEPIPPTINVNVTNQMPGQPAPVVNVEVRSADQPAPIVNNVVNVPDQAAPVVNVAAPEVTVNVPPAQSARKGYQRRKRED